jgi:hypothetical protein
MRIDEIKNTQKNGGRGKKDSGKSTEMRYNKAIYSNFIYRK